MFSKFMLSKFKKLSIFSLSLSMLALSACSGTKSADPSSSVQPSASTASVEKVDPFGKYPEPITVKTIRATNSDPKLPPGESYEDNMYNRLMQEKLNIKPQYIWTAPSDGFAYKNKLELAIAANDIPDVFAITGTAGYMKSTLKRLVEAGMVEDLSKAYEKFASPAIKDAYQSEKNRLLDYFKIDGKMYALPSQTDNSGFEMFWIREDWRKQLNLPEPKTFDDVLSIAKAFKEKDPAGGGKTVPWALQMQTEPTGLFGGTTIFNQYKSFPRVFYKDTNGKVTYGGIAPQTKDALGKLAEMYKDGLFEKDFAVKDANKGRELLSSGNAGIVGQQWWAVWYPLNVTVQNKPEADWKPYIIPGKDGKVSVASGMPTGTIVVVKKGYKYPEVPIKWLNVYNVEKNKKSYIDIGLNQYKSAVDKAPIWLNYDVDRTDVSRVMARNIADVLDGKKQKDQLENGKEIDAVDVIGKYKPIMDQPDARKKDLNGWQNYTGWIQAMGGLSKAPLDITLAAYQDKTPTMEKKMTALENLQMDVYLKIIMGQKPIDAFDKFVEDWKSQGGNEILAEIEKEISK